MSAVERIEAAITETADPTHVCIDCGTTDAPVLAAVWDNGGAFSAPSGFACMACRPLAFDAWMRDLEDAS